MYTVLLFDFLEKKFSQLNVKRAAKNLMLTNKTAWTAMSDMNMMKETSQQMAGWYGLK